MLTTLTRLFPLWAIGCSLLAYQAPSLFTGLGHLIAPGLSLIMLFMGLTLSFKDFYQVTAKWPALLTGTFLQFAIMPLSGLLISKLLNLPQDIAIGMILAGSVAGGTASNVLCYLARGDVALSIAMTAVSTLLGSFLTPLLISVLAHQYIEVDPIPMIWGVAKIVLLPVTLGLLINHWCHRYVQRCLPVFPLLSMMTIVLVIAVVVASNASLIPTLGLITVLAVICHNSTGLILGYSITALLGFDQKTRRTVALEVGLQNSGLAVVLATKFFSPAAALPGTFFSIWHNISGSTLAAWWSRNSESSGETMRQ